MLTLTLLLVLAAFGTLIAHVVWKQCPLWVPIFLLVMVHLLVLVPLR